MNNANFQAVNNQMHIIAQDHNCQVKAGVMLLEGEEKYIEFDITFPEKELLKLTLHHRPNEDPKIDNVSVTIQEFRLKKGTDGRYLNAKVGQINQILDSIYKSIYSLDIAFRHVP